MSVLQKIKPEDYITDNDPIPVELLDASGWYETKTATLVINDKNATDSNRQALVWKQAQGWVITDSIKAEKDITVDDVPTTIYTTTHTLTRRRLKADVALKALIAQSTENYNEGRELNDTRYDDIVALYERTLDKTEDNLQEQEVFEGVAYEKIKAIADGLPADFAEYEEEDGVDLDGYGTAQRARINLQWDNVVSERRSSMIDRGIYNTLTWDSVYTGIEGERTIALNDFEDKLLRLRADLAGDKYSRKISMRDGVMNAYYRLKDMLQNGKLPRVQLQIRIMDALVNFMERRTDGYPDINSIGQMAAQFGSANSTEITP